MEMKEEGECNGRKGECRDRKKVKSKEAEMEANRTPEWNAEKKGEIWKWGLI